MSISIHCHLNALIAMVQVIYVKTMFRFLAHGVKELDSKIRQMKTRNHEKSRGPVTTVARA